MDRFLLQSKTGQRIPSKTVYLVRHGQSTHNVHYYQSEGADLNSARYLDAALTPLGISQAEKLPPEIVKLRPELVVTSPMTRATQTCIHATKGLSRDVEFVVNPLCRERLAYSCDIGSCRQVLERRFPMLDYGELENVWWWTPSEDIDSAERSLELLRTNPPGAFKQGIAYTKGVEPAKHVQTRVNDFRKWLLQRPEERIVVFAHGVFNVALLGDGSRMGNCEIRKLIL